MECRQIISEIDSIYTRFRVMPQLEAHMRRVAGVVAFIAEHWRGPALDRDLLLAAALVHDLGNIAKVNFDGQHTQELMGAEYAHLDHWRAVQRELVAQYGSDEYEMTTNMLKELGAPKEVIMLILAAGFRQNVDTAQCSDWNCKVLAHADHVVAPRGVVPLAERLDEGQKRYGYTDEHHPFVQAAYTIQEQISMHLTVPVNSITEVAIREYIPR